MMKNIHVLLGIMCVHSAVHAMLSSDVPNWKVMYSTLEGKYQDYLKDTLKECKETNAVWNMDDLIKVGKTITKQDEATLKAVICAMHDEHDFTFAHTLIQDPDALFEFVKQNYSSFAHNKHNVAALDCAINNLEDYTQDIDRIMLDPEGFEKASCSVYILLNYVKNVSCKSSERAMVDDFGSCCEKHTFPGELDFIESKMVKSDMLALLDKHLKLLEQELEEYNPSSFSLRRGLCGQSRHSAECATVDYDVISRHHVLAKTGSAEGATADSYDLPSEECVEPVVVDSKEKESTCIVVLSDEHIVPKVTDSLKSPDIIAFVPFGSKLKPLEGEPKNGSKVIVKDHDCYVWGTVRGRAVHNNIGIVYKQKNGVSCGDVFSLNKLYELV